MISVMKFFGYPNAAAFRADWQKLTENDREQLKTGIENGSLTY